MYRIGEFSRKTNLSVRTLRYYDDIGLFKPKEIDLFTNYEEVSKQKEKSLKDEIEEKKIQKALLNIKKKYGKNSILKAMNYEEGATAKNRNLEVGGHKG